MSEQAQNQEIEITDEMVKAGGQILADQFEAGLAAAERVAANERAWRETSIQPL